MIMSWLRQTFDFLLNKSYLLLLCPVSAAGSNDYQRIHISASIVFFFPLHAEPIYDFEFEVSSVRRWCCGFRLWFR